MPANNSNLKPITTQKINVLTQVSRSQSFPSPIFPQSPHITHWRRGKVGCKTVFKSAISRKFENNLSKHGFLLSTEFSTTAKIYYIEFFFFPTQIQATMGVSFPNQSQLNILLDHYSKKTSFHKSFLKISLLLGSNRYIIKVTLVPNQSLD